MYRFLLVLLLFSPTLEAQQEIITVKGYRLPILKASGDPCWPDTMIRVELCQKKWERMVRTGRTHGPNSNQRTGYRQFPRGTVVDAWHCEPQGRFCVLLKGDSCTCSGSGNPPQG